MRGVDIRTAQTIANEGWNATTLELYSHFGTHTDAPAHFVDGAATIDQQDLSVCVGTALMIDLTLNGPVSEALAKESHIVCCWPITGLWSPERV